MVKASKESNTKIGKYLAQNLGEEVKLLSEVSSEITYQIPSRYAGKFQGFFEDFDRRQDQLDIRGYGISITTLEEVFLRVGHGEGINDDNIP